MMNPPSATTARRNSNRARCQQAGCEKFAQTRGLCKAHGGGSRCRDPTCNKLAQSRGLCIAHGGGRRCQSDGCQKLAQSKGFCISHGGGRRCTVPNCEKFSQVKGRCKSHSKQFASSSSTASSAASSPSSSPVHAAAIVVAQLAHEPHAKFSIDFLVNRNVRAPEYPSYGAPVVPTNQAFVNSLQYQRTTAQQDDDGIDEASLLRRGSVDRVVDPFTRIPSIAPRTPEISSRRHSPVNGVVLPRAAFLELKQPQDASFSTVKHNSSFGLSGRPSLLSFLQRSPVRSAPSSASCHRITLPPLSITP